MSYAQHHDEEYAPHHDEDAQVQKFPERRGCRDLIWAVLFVLHIVGIIVLAAVMHHKYQTNGQSPREEERDHSLKMNHNAWALLGIFVVTGFVTSAFWLSVMQRYAEGLIKFCLAFSVVMLGAVSILFFAMGEPLAGGLFLVACVFNMIYAYVVRNRIPFTARILEIVAEVIRQFPATVYFAYFSIVVQIWWLVVWVIAAGSTLNVHQEADTDNGSRGVIYFFLLVSFFWTAQVIKNVLHVTVAGLLATWYFFRSENMPSNPTVNAFKRASWTSFGSICLGSLLIAVIKAVREMVNSVRDTKHWFVKCIANCLLLCLDQLVSYFNIYAFTRVAIYGETYCEAAINIWHKISSGRTVIAAVINDNLTGSVLFFGSLIAGMVGCAVGAIFGHFVFKMDQWGVWCFAGFLIAFAMTMVALEVISSSVSAFFVCFAEDPEALLHTGKEHVHQQLTQALHDGGFDVGRGGERAGLISGRGY